MKITRSSTYSGTVRTLDLDVTEEEIKAWQHGTLIQEAMPRLSDFEREFVQTGITEEEWNKMFPPEEEDDDAE